MATPFGDSVGKIIALIDKEMIPQVKEAHKVNQKVWCPPMEASEEIRIQRGSAGLQHGPMGFL